MIIEGNYNDYLFLFGEGRTAYSDYSARISAAGGKIYIMLLDGVPAGYLCAVRETNSARLCYGFTVPAYRGRGVFKSLAAHAAGELPKPIGFNILSESKYYGGAVKACTSIGFERSSVCNVYGCAAEDFAKWKEYMNASGNRLRDYLEKHGYSAASFAEAGGGVCGTLYNSAENAFGNRLDIKPFFDNPEKNMNGEMSFVTLKDGEPAAYTLVSCPDGKNAVFEQISASKKYEGSGCVLLCFAGSMESFEKFGCKRASYAMYGENVRANSFRKKLLERVTSSVKRSENYVLIGGTK
ncbi:MAG: hypothetical protein NC253_02295 [Ruminococcus sp.]|nr:hypothetical protein [Ruminococcus sp.]MCM1381279.1 hypothetical protein [Muribaculaceae bacterium]MCM1478502.1 hypothetical protein [Muribaculaceae bacterium]